MNAQPAINYLQSIEWRIGNGQCPACYGCKPGGAWYPTDKVGHKTHCPLACALNGLGKHVDYDLLPKPEPEDEIPQRVRRAD